MLKYYFLSVTISIFMLSLSVTAQAPHRGAFAWHAILDFEESASKEELFDLLLAELFFSADFGFKAKDIQYSTAGIPEIGDQPLFMAQGEIIPTANFLDFAKNGTGFFFSHDGHHDFNVFFCVPANAVENSYAAHSFLCNKIGDFLIFR